MIFFVQVALITMDDEYVQKLILGVFAKRPHWKVHTEPPIKHDEDEQQEPKKKSTSNETYHFKASQSLWFKDAITLDNIETCLVTDCDDEIDTESVSSDRRGTGLLSHQTKKKLEVSNKAGTT